MNAAEELFARLAGDRAWRNDHDPTLTLQALTAKAGMAVPEDLGALTLDGLEARVSAEWTTWVGQLLDAARSLSLPGCKVNILQIEVRALNTHHLNASSWALGDGSALIVLNRSLMTLIYEICRALSGRAVTSPSEEPPLTVEEAGYAAVAVLDWVRTSGTAGVIPLDLPPDNLAVAYSICGVAERFLFAHEVAHLVLGHHDGCMGAARNILISTCDPALDELNEPPRTIEELHREEHEADCLGIALLLHLRGRGEMTLDRALPFGAVELFFRIQEEVENLALSDGVGIEEDLPSHPSADLRSKVVRQFIEDLPGAADAWDQGRAYSTLFEHLLSITSPYEQRADDAARSVSAALVRCSTEPIPDYGTFEALIAESQREINEPLILAALAKRVAEVCPSILGDEVEATARFRHLLEFKLVYSVVRKLDATRRFAFREMLVMAGGTHELDALWDVGPDA